MKNTEIIEGNKLLNAFMAEVTELTITLFDYNINALYDWNRLMQICYEWANLEFDLLGIKVYIEYKMKCDALNSAVINYELLPVFSQLVENVKWYNTIK